MKILPSILALLWCVTAVTAQPALRINEFMASNGSSAIDPDFGQTASWIEIYNAGSTTVNMAGLFLSNDLVNPTMWPVPVGTFLNPGEYLVFWADEANIKLHTNFELSIEGGEIGLFDSDGTPISSIIYGPQKTDVAFGLLNNTAGVWRFLATPTPGLANVAAGFIGFAEPVTFSTPGGFYTTTQLVELSTAGEGAIHYTTDGTEPTEASPVYALPLSVGSTVVLRAAAFQAGFLPGEVASETYLLNENTGLPVVSIVADPADLFSDDRGIYVEGTNGIEGNCSEGPRNWNQDWEILANIEFFDESGSELLNQRAGVKIAGTCSRNYAQKSLSLHARAEYGAPTFKYPFFNTKPANAFSTLVLRNSGQDWFRTMFRDGLVHTLLGQGGIDHLGYWPTVVYINGVYWGIHNLREAPDASFIEQNYGLDASEVDLLEGRAVPMTGSEDGYNELLEFIRNNDMTSAQSLATVGERMDIDQYLDYQVAQIYVANTGWPSSNIRYWRSTAPDGKWRWIFYDADFGFAGNPEGAASVNSLQRATDPAGPDWPNPPWSTELLRGLLTNDEVKHRFVQRLASHANITFAPTHVNAVIDSLQANLAADQEAHKERWPESIGFNTPWDLHIEEMRAFPAARAVALRSHVADVFGFDQTTTLQLSTNEPGRGHLFVSDVQMRGEAFEGTYYSNVPLELRAVPLPGYTFVGWEGDVVASEDSLSIVLETPTAIQAVFDMMVDTTPTEDVASPYQFELGQNYPNPFRTRTTLPFELAAAEQVTIRIVDMLGREVMRVREDHLPAGNHLQEIQVEALAAGIYLLELRAGRFVDRTTITVVQ